VIRLAIRSVKGLIKGIFIPKGVNPKYMFKDEGRRKQFLAVNRSLGFFLGLATFALIGSMVMFGLIFGAWLLLWILSLGLLNILAGGSPFLETVVLIALVSLIAFLVLHMIKFAFQWGYVLAESRSLSKNPEENKDYIAVARVVRRTKIANIITLFVFVGLVYLVYLVFGGNTKFDTDNSMWIIGVGLVVIVLNKIYNGRQKKSVREEIDRIKKTK